MLQKQEKTCQVFRTSLSLKENSQRKIIYCRFWEAGNVHLGLVWLGFLREGRLRIRTVAEANLEIRIAALQLLCNDISIYIVITQHCDFSERRGVAHEGTPKVSVEKMFRAKTRAHL
jgi:hypothetical protein